ncbi:hypothetical protein F4820DRAFT_425667 [Hypoxylon rubiginosum]|uniref:Uncharacterized protein n=1 Tax=Hypoxylon rubiginosum TaxID=110542 RepID=A0ACB9YXR2_9PEZI|nr:hypothetical protein F4820DRAFT_425667 [Hypoxylon rubiginosum]
MAANTASDIYDPVSHELQSSLAERREKTIGGVNIDNASVEDLKLIVRELHARNQALEEQAQIAQARGGDLAEQLHKKNLSMDEIRKRMRHKRSKISRKTKDLKKQITELRIQNENLELRNDLLQLYVEDLQHRGGMALEQNGLLQRRNHDLPRQIDAEPNASNHHSDTTQRTLRRSTREAHLSTHRRHAQSSDSNNEAESFHGREFTINIKAKEEDI